MAMIPVFCMSCRSVFASPFRFTGRNISLQGNKEVAAEFLIGESTVKTHVIDILNKLGVKGRTQAVAEAARRGIIRL